MKQSCRVPRRQQHHSHSQASLIGYYARRGGIECGLRDTKDLRFGMGLGAIHVKSPERRDRLWLINAFAVVLLTLLGAAGEALGYDRMLKTNTAKRRVHSLFRQGCMLYDLIPNDAGNSGCVPLMQRFSSNAARPAALRRRFRAGLINEGSLEAHNGVAQIS